MSERKEASHEMIRVIEDAFARGTQALKAAPYSFDQIVLCGIGSSAAVNTVVQSLCHASKIPILLHTSADLPAYASSKTLLIISSYTGAEREISTLARSTNRTGAQVAIITSGGQLLHQAKDARSSLVELPDYYSEAFAFYALLFALVGVADRLGLTSISAKEVQHIGLTLSNTMWKQKAVAIAGKLHEQIPALCIPERYRGIGVCWQYFLEVAAQMPCVTATLTELPHRSFCGFMTELHSFFALFIHDEFEMADARKHITVTKNLFEQQSVPSMELVLKGQSEATKVATACYLGILVSFALARMNARNPNDRSLYNEFNAAYKRAL